MRASGCPAYCKLVLRMPYQIDPQVDDAVVLVAVVVAGVVTGVTLRYVEAEAVVVAVADALRHAIATAVDLVQQQSYPRLADPRTCPWIVASYERPLVSEIDFASVLSVLTSVVMSEHNASLELKRMSPDSI
jgi:hypothetical protein